MKLTTLTMIGFRAYRSATTLDLAGIRAAGIRGENGAGKSTLIEAIEWCLCGSSRSATVDGVISIGADAAEVELDFDAGGVGYKVVRCRGRSGGSLTLLRWTQAGWATELTGKTTRETQAEIDKLLGISADALFSSAILRQGDQGRFASASPRDRRRILRELADLGRWDIAQAAANDRRRSTIAAIEARPTVDVEAAAARVREAEQAHDAAVQAERSAEDRAQATVTTKDAATDRRQRAEQRLRDTRAELERLLPASVDANRLRVEMLRLGERQRRLAEANARLAAADEGAAWWRDHYTAGSRIEDIRHRLQDVQKHYDKQTDARRMAALRAEISAGRRARAEAVKAAGDECIPVLSVADAHAAVARAEAAVSAAERAAEIRTSAPCTTQCPDMAQTCPLLSDVRRAADGLADASADLVRAQAALQSAEATVAWKAREDELTREGRELAARYMPGTPLVTDEPMAEIGIRIEVLIDEIGDALDACACKDAAEVQARGQASFAAYSSLDAIRRECALLAEAVAASEAAKAQLDQVDGERIDALRAQAAALELEIEDAAGAESDAQRWLTDFYQGEGRRLAIIVQACEAELRTAHDCLDKARATADELLRLRAELDKWCAVREAAAIAPTLLLEAVAIPQLELEANRVLSDLSTTGMQVELRTTRHRRSGDGQVETLDIIVRDEIGERPYEDYSGGERFRVDIAFALAQSALLAGRRGTAPDWLIVDEGWGNLDVEGVAALKDVFTRLQERYSLLLVVTHVAEAAECLPRQITVMKGADGAKIEVT